MTVRQKFFSLISVFLISLLTYLPFLHNQLFWDDEQFIYKNQYVQTADVRQIFTTNTLAGAGESSNYYRPLTTLSFALDYQFWGANPIGFHLTNALLHSLAAVMVCLVLVQLGLGWLPSMGIALIFAVHPLQTEAVVYANSRGDSLYTLLGLVSIYALLRALTRRVVTWQLYDLHIRLTPKMWAITSVVSYAACILAKEIGIAVGGLLFASVVTQFLRNKAESRSKTTTLPWLIVLASAMLALSYLALRFTILQFQPTLNLYGDTPYGTSAVVRLLTFSKVVWQYALLLFVPYPLHMERSITPVESWWSTWPWLTLGAALTLVWLAVREYQKRTTLWIGLGATWCITMLIPVSGIFPINGMLYEHWLYLPMVGFWLLLYGLHRFWWPTFRFQKAHGYLFALCCAIWLLLSWRQNYLWANPIRFYSYTLQFANTARLHNNLAMALAEAGRLPEAIDEYQKALDLNDNYPQIYFNLGNARAALGDAQAAESAYQHSLELNPRFAPAYRGLFTLYTREGQATEAAQLQSRFTSVFGE